MTNETYHDRGTQLAIRHPTDEALNTRLVLGVATERRRTVVYRRPRYQVPVPGSADILVFISLDICIRCAVGEVESDRILQVGALGVSGARRVHLESGNIVLPSSYLWRPSVSPGA
jgi:hypothetical protein